MRKPAAPFVFAFILVLGFIVAGCLFVYREFEESQKRTEAYSAAASLAAALATELQSDNAALPGMLNLKDGEDKCLSSSEYDELILVLSKRHTLDLPKAWRDTGILIDPWGNRYEIVLKWVGFGQWCPSVRSYGPDGIPLTKDDVVR